MKEEDLAENQPIMIDNDGGDDHELQGAALAVVLERVGSIDSNAEDAISPQSHQ